MRRRVLTIAMAARTTTDCVDVRKVLAAESIRTILAVRRVFWSKALP
jgi:hypothetical protein